MKKYIFLSGLSLALITIFPTITTSAPNTANGNVNNGKALFQTCIACHGIKGEGNQVIGAPRISGQHDWYLIRQLKNFKAGIRGSHARDTKGAIMKPMAMTLINDQAIDDVVAYITTLK